MSSVRITRSALPFVGGRQARVIIHGDVQAVTADAMHPRVALAFGDWWTGDIARSLGRGRLPLRRECWRGSTPHHGSTTQPSSRPGTDPREAVA